MPLETIEVLSIEDNAGDARLIREMLHEASALGWDLPQFELTCVSTLAAGLEHLDQGDVDVVLSDLDLPDSRAGDTFARLRTHVPCIPIVVLTGREDEALARHTVRAGADDYLFKREMNGSLLAHALLYAIERQRARVALQEAHDDLERRVQERTAELEHANAQLQQEIAERRRAESQRETALEALQKAHDKLERRVKERTVELAQANQALRVEVAERLQAESALQDSEKRYRLLFEKMMNGFALHEIIADEKGQPIDYVFLEVNSAFEQLVGLKREDLIGKKVTEVLPGIKGDAADWTSRYGQVALTGQDTRFEQYSHFLEKWYSVIAFSPQRDQFATIFEDITERKWAEQVLRQSEERLRLLVQNMPVMIDALDAEGNIVLWNRECERVTGYSADEIIGNPEAITLLYPAPERLKQVVAEITDHSADFCDCQWDIRCKDGDTRTVSWTNISNAVPIPGWAQWAVGLDITERVQAEAQRETALQALQKSEKKFRTLVENVVDWVWQVDRDGAYTYVSPQAEKIMGYPASEILGQTPFDFMAPEEAKRVGAIFSQTAAKHERILGLKDTMLTRDGREVLFETNATPLFDQEGTFIGYMGTCRDITQQVQAESQRQAAIEALRRRNRELVMLNQASQVLVSILDLDQVLVNVLEKVRDLLDVTACSIWLTDPETDELVCQQATGPQSEIVRDWRLAPGQGLAGQAACSGESLIVSDAQSDARHFEGVDQQTGLGLRAILTVPLRVKNGVIGVLQVVDTAIDRFSATDLELLEPLATSAAIAIENARLYEQTCQDAETQSVLLREVNHRVKNNLTSVLGLLYVARDHVAVTDRATYLATMNDLIGRVRGLATAHDLLSASKWTPLQLSDLVSRIIHVSLEALPRDKQVSVRVSPSPICVTADQAHQLALVIGELTTNTAKHALKARAQAQITVRITREGDDTVCEFRDDGPGYTPDVLQSERHNVGFDLIHNIARNGLRGSLTLRNERGAVAVIRFPTQVRSESPLDGTKPI